LSADTSGAINVLLKTIADEHDTDVLNRMGVDLGRLVGQLSESQLLPAARAIIAVWMGAFDFDQQKVMGDQFGVLVRRLQWSDRDELRRMAVEQLRLEASSASAAGSAYRLLTQDVDAGQAAIIVQELLGFIDGNQPSVRIAISEMRRMVGLLDKEEKFKVAKSLASILSRLADMSSVSQTSSRIPPRSQSTSIDQVAGSLALALNVAVVGSPEERRGELADSLIVSLSETRLPAAAAALGSVLAVVPGDGLPRPAYISRLSAALSATKKSQVVTALTGAILRVVSLQPPDDATAAAYVEVMRYPARSREAAVAFREQFKGAPSADRGYWALIGWMQARWPQLPLTERPKEPA
jgi:hypothetical protein